ncbi:RelA/SpoT family protein [Halosquirtibacter laminarini]|uniref:RelA/SpoT family protein n=1 Tax=Halosquirtibacter laminarini TaxID=3374600 RepID=A0AC61NNV1_9BACT|nr:RelA/SpoT family protein [Prolixibacteraceae bacterium]
MNLQTEAEKRYIKDLYEDLLQSFNRPLTDENRQLLEKAFLFANDAHMGIRRKSGEPYIVHPLAVAKIVTSEIGLGTKAAISAILHDVVEDTDYTLEDIENLFGPKIAYIVDGLTKLSGNFDSKQAANFRKMLLTLSDDVRVILIKLADRLHNMRTLDAMPQHKQLKIAGETLFIFAPLAHRLGLYRIKTELEDLSLKYKHPEEYNEIKLKLFNNQEQRKQLVNDFCKPIEKKLKEEGFDIGINGRPKSIYSIWNKMQNKGVKFDEIYDLLAIRIIFNPNEDKSEKRQCFDILSLVTDIYKPRPDRIRDWITIPKANGYEALHVTVMGPEGKWVEVQIRSRRMDEVAERGFAAHYKYKGIESKEKEKEIELNRWFEKIREVLQNSENDALDFLDDFKLNLFSDEIVVFTPKGEMKILPKNATVLDFAYDIHTHLGDQCIGAKINHKLVPFSQKLSSGDQIEILTSSKQKPSPEWLTDVVTSRAKEKIRNSFKKEHKNHIEKGQELLEEAIQSSRFQLSSNTIKKIIRHFSLNTKEQLYANLGMGIIDLDNINQILEKKSENKFVKYWRLTFSKKRPQDDEKTIIDKKKPFLLGETNKDYVLSECCLPLPGDQVIGYVGEEHIVIHKRTCSNAIKIMANQGDKIVTAQWTKFKLFSSLAQIRVKGLDRVGILNDITNIISKQNDINIRSVTFEAHDGIFEGLLYLYIHNVQDLEDLIDVLKRVKGVDSVVRLQTNK